MLQGDKVFLGVVSVSRVESLEAAKLAFYVCELFMNRFLFPTPVF